MSQAKFQSLRSKITRTFLLVMGSTALATLAIIVFTSAQASSEHLASVQKYIEQGITSKGKVLTENHARALRGLTLDNALLDMQRLVDRVVQEDTDLVYGLYVNSNRETMAYSRRGKPALDKPPAKDAWSELQIPTDQLLVNKESVTRTSRLGEDVLEVAVPVSGDDGELLGTVRYGLATRPMSDAIARARLDSRARMQRSIVWLVTMVTIATLLGQLLSGVQAKRITQPIASLTIAAEALAKGNRSVSVDVTTGDEIGLLGASFNRMGADLDASYRALETLNRELEKKVELRTAELGNKHRDLKLVLDNVGQGFVTVDLDGKMSPERSRVIKDWFGPAGDETKLSAYLGRAQTGFEDWFDVCWLALRDDVMPMAVCLDQLPGTIQQVARNVERTFELAYRPIMQGESIEKVIVVITDVTARIESARAEQTQLEMMSIFKHAIADRMGLASFFAETGAIVDSVATAVAPDLTLLRRQIHTIKGNTAMFGLESVATFCDRVERKMDEADASMSPEDRKALAEMWAKVTHTRNQLTGEGSAGGIELESDEYGAFIGALERKAPHADLLETASAWRFEAVWKRLAILKEQIQTLAKRLGRAPVTVVVEPTQLRLPSAQWGAFWTSFSHVLRNTVDHGVGTVQERTAAGKPAEATVSLNVARVDDGVVITVTDDGPGINWQAIAARAIEQGLPHGTPAELSAALFADGVSSRTDVTTTSGRGVGLAAVLQVVQSLGGEAKVHSTPGKGATFTFRLPASMKSDA